jgi:hypothetical protein
VYSEDDAHLLFTSPEIPSYTPRVDIPIDRFGGRFMSTASKVRTGQEVIEAMMTADTPAAKAKATRLKNEYVARRVAEGKDAKKVLAGLLSRVNRLRNEEARAKAAPKKAAAKTAAAKKK